MSRSEKPNPFEAPMADANAGHLEVGADDLGSACKWLVVIAYILGAIGLCMLGVGVLHVLGVAEFENAEISLLGFLYLLAAWPVFRCATLLKTDFARYYKRTYWLVVVLSILVLPYCTVPGVLVIRRMSKHRTKQNGTLEAEPS